MLRFVGYWRSFFLFFFPEEDVSVAPYARAPHIPEENNMYEYRFYPIEPVRQLNKWEISFSSQNR